jgi:hypothetical protein
MVLPEPETHQDKLRSLAETLPGDKVRRILLDAADRLDEVETQVKIVNRIGGLNSGDNLDVRLKMVEEKLKQVERGTKQYVTRLDLEMLTMQLQTGGL